MALLRSNQPVTRIDTGVANMSDLKAWGRQMTQDVTEARASRIARYSQSGIVANTLKGRAQLGLLGLRKLFLRR